MTPDLGKQLVNIVILLPQGGYCVEKINKLTANANFSTHQGRVAFMQKLVKLVHSNTMDGWIQIYQPTTGADTQAKLIWQKQMRDAEVQTVVLNVSPPEGDRQYEDHRKSKSLPAAEENYCLLGLVLTVPEYKTVEHINFQQLHRLPEIFTADNVFYYWFGPNTTGVSLTEAQRLFTKIRSAYFNKP
ncbi:MAG: hypothetical protein AAF378_21440 [Cyanobacteria bacterium P01_A01_bin.84]